MIDIQIEGFENFAEKAYALWDSDHKKNQKGITGYRIFGTTINIHVSTHTGVWECSFSQMIMCRKGKARGIQSISIEEVLDQLPQEAVEILIMSPYLFENRKEHGE